MKALVTHQYGSPEDLRIEEIETPYPEQGQLQVRLSASAVNPADMRLLSGELSAFLKLPFPHVMGNDFAGTVTAVGSGVTGFSVGDEIFGYASPRVMRPMAGSRPSVGTGSMAEFMVIEADTPVIAHRPQNVDPSEAAAFATTGLTALAASRAGKVMAGEKILVIGASGGVGTALVSILASQGVDVVATAKPQDQDILEALGAKQFTSYDISSFPNDLDAIFNLALPGNELSEVADHLGSGGRLISITMPPLEADLVARDDIEAIFVADTECNLATMDEIASLLEKGTVKPVIGESFSLENAADAYAAYYAKHIVGKLVVTF